MVVYDVQQWLSTIEINGSWLGMIDTWLRVETLYFWWTSHGHDLFTWPGRPGIPGQWQSCGLTVGMFIYPSPLDKKLTHPRSNDQQITGINCSHGSAAQYGIRVFDGQMIFCGIMISIPYAQTFNHWIRMRVSVRFWVINCCRINCLSVVVIDHS